MGITNIKDIKQDVSKYDGKKVKIEGEHTFCNGAPCIKDEEGNFIEVDLGGGDPAAFGGGGGGGGGGSTTSEGIIYSDCCRCEREGEIPLYICDITPEECGMYERVEDIYGITDYPVFDQCEFLEDYPILVT